MSYKVLYRKYRPKNFEELIGQNSIKESLINALKNGRLAHAYIFTGPRGTGKTSTAKIFAKALTCLSPQNGDSCSKCENCKSFEENPDIIEIDAASNNGVDEIREIRNNVKLVPTISKYKIYIIDEVHMLSMSAWNAFLKTLEEPPEHVIFIFATTDIQKVPLTVLSRCQRYDFQRISDIEIEEHIKNITKKEKINISEDAIKELVKLSDGCLRDCLSYLDQLSKISLDIKYDNVKELFGVIDQSSIISLTKSIKENNIEEYINSFNFLKKRGIDVNNLITNLIDYLVSEASKIKLGQDSLIKDFDFCQRILNDLFEIQSKIKFIDNSYNLFFMKFLSYFETKKNNSEKNDQVSKEVKKDVQNIHDNISREIIDKDYDEELKKIRINNVFCKANKKLKIDFLSKWDKFVSLLNEDNNYTILGYVNNMNIEVVSDEYVLFSTNNVSDSVIFNNNLENIENEFKKFIKEEYKYISLSADEWLKEKENFIKNKDKKRNLIDESTIKSEKDDNSLEDIAKDIFGDIIEVK